MQFTIPCTLIYNKYSIITKALANTKANRYAFINILYVINIAKQLQLRFIRLLELIKVKEYNSAVSNTITHVLKVYLRINNYN